MSARPIFPACSDTKAAGDRLVELMAAVRDGGGLWRGVQQGLPEKGIEAMVLFDDAKLPRNCSSSMALRLSEATPEAVRKQIQEMRERYSKDAASLGASPIKK